jgi:hypothetical protein
MSIFGLCLVSIGLLMCVVGSALDIDSARAKTLGDVLRKSGAP